MTDNTTPAFALQEVQIESSVDHTAQPCVYHAPPDAGAKVPLLVFLHQWSHDYRVDNEPWVRQAAGRGWCYLHPNFRGPNWTPEACGSELARQDILDAVQWAKAHLPVDPRRIYLAGVSGGGHMAMLMAAMAPHAFAAVSEWVGISDLAVWHAEHYRGGQVGNYARNIEQSVGGPPGSSPEVDRQLYLRSPLFHLAAAKALPIDFNAGITDGHTGSVPTHHTIDAFNVIARSLGEPPVTPEEIRDLWTRQRLVHPQPQDEAPDPTYQDRGLLLRRHAGPSRLTIFQGGHEGLPFAACEWLAGHRTGSV